MKKSSRGTQRKYFQYYSIGYLPIAIINFYLIFAGSVDIKICTMFSLGYYHMY